MQMTVSREAEEEDEDGGRCKSDVLCRVRERWEL